MRRLLALSLLHRPRRHDLLRGPLAALAAFRRGARSLEGGVGAARRDVRARRCARRHPERARRDPAGCQGDGRTRPGSRRRHQRALRDRHRLLAARPDSACPGHRERVLLDRRPRLAGGRDAAGTPRGDDRHRDVGRHRRRAARTGRCGAAAVTSAASQRSRESRRSRLLLAVLALRTPSPPPEERQPLRLMLVALRERTVLAGMWLLTLPPLLFGTLSVLGAAPARRARLGRARGRGDVRRLGAASRRRSSPASDAGRTVAAGWRPIQLGLAAEPRRLPGDPLGRERLALSIVVVCAGIAVRHVLGAVDGVALRRMGGRRGRARASGSPS